MIDKNKLGNDLARIREISPLVHNITNYVAMNFTANALLAVGASPVMSHAVEETEEMVSIANSLVINIGTLDPYWVEGMKRAAAKAYELGKPWVLDPVGAGATSYRTRTALGLIEKFHPSIIRGNGSEIMALTNYSIKSKGVDSSASSESALQSAQQLAKETGSVVVISGATDFITDGSRIECVKNGSGLMTKVTAMGCTASSMVGVFAAINNDPFEAAAHAMALISICGEIAAEKCPSPGSLQTNFVDELFTITPNELANSLKQ